MSITLLVNDNHLTGVTKVLALSTGIVIQLWVLVV